VSAPAVGLETSFPLDPATQQRFLEGLDDIAITLRYAGDITSFEANRPEWLPTA
jgi:3-isopropylmalate/(R)-2-methylmalate dehydratase small subunit